MPKRRLTGRGHPSDTLAASSAAVGIDDDSEHTSTSTSSASSSALAPFSQQSLAPFVAGVAGGSVSTALLFPLDLIKVRMQVNEEARFRTDNASPFSRQTTGGGPSRRRPTIASSLRNVVKYEGVLGLYQGLSPALVASAVSWGGYFFLYEGMKKQVLNMRKATGGGGGKSRTRPTAYGNESGSEEGNDPQPDDRLSPMENFTAACLAGAAMVCITNPIWLIKTRMQLQLKQLKDTVSSSGNVKKIPVKPYNGLFDAAFTIVREEGPLALYKGSSVAMVMVSHGGIQFVAYEFLKSRFGSYTRAERAKKRDSERISILEKIEDSLGYLTMGAASKIIASTFTYPLQVIKSRLQQRAEAVDISQEGKITVKRREYRGVVDCVSRIWRNEGVLGFFKGCVPNALRVAPSSAITFVVYESVMDVLGKE
mmetsp:Transcript_36468/g.79401  ORF Transcript_36468/g.79401 Transcript_36468/m.79401 type:complete len:425 (+) Transcript_36468:98-1372(+)